MELLAAFLINLKLVNSYFYPMELVSISWKKFLTTFLQSVVLEKRKNINF